MMHTELRSTSQRKRTTRTTNSSIADDSTNCHDLSACDVISMRVRRRHRSFSRISLSPSNSCTVAPPKPLMLLFVAIASFFLANKVTPVYSLSAAKNEWIGNSLQYYNRITRGAEHVQQSPTYLKSAMENYFALEKLRNNKPRHAETIYRRLMDEFNPRQGPFVTKPAVDSMHADAEECEFSQLAVPTLLLGLLLQREGRFDDARTVFEGFSHVLEDANGGKAHACCCSARVLQAHALFEMKQDNPVKAAELIMKAVRMDKNLRSVLRWKLFREAMAEYRKYQRECRRHHTRSELNRQVLAVAAA